MSKKLAKDIDTIYASFELDECNYTELNEDERYHSIKKKWLMLNAMSRELASKEISASTTHHE